MARNVSQQKLSKRVEDKKKIIKFGARARNNLALLHSYLGMSVLLVLFYCCCSLNKQFPSLLIRSIFNLNMKCIFFIFGCAFGCR